ncbi:hypothetical protein HZA57_01580 [Candidatus Poribacteria bacterium]|nr:hypothetical protein [Candidatus Poribacteria bacterium]
MIPTPPPARPRVADLAWISGDWTRDDGELIIEEQWGAPRAGSMLGMVRIISNGETVLYEFMAIAETAEGICFTSVSGAGEVVRYQLAESGPDKAIFAEPRAECPRRVSYFRLPNGDLLSRVEGDAAGAPRFDEYLLKRPAKR